MILSKSQQNYSLREGASKTRTAKQGVPTGIQLVPIRTRVRPLALLSGLGIQHCHELRCGSQTRLRSGIAMAVA